MTVTEARSEFLDFVKTLVSTGSYTLADILSNDFSTVVSVVGAKIDSSVTFELSNKPAMKLIRFL